MAENKKIPCRVCGKLFVPCTYCQTHADVFRWRNFACSKECAIKYINDTITYRESLKVKSNNTSENSEIIACEIPTEKITMTRKKSNKKSSIDNTEDETKTNETA